MALEDIERLKEKIARDPNSKLFVPLAEEYKMYDEAIDTLTKGLDQQPGYLSARVSLGKIYIERGMLAEARAEFEKVISAIPDNLYAHKKLAEIYREVGEKDKAVQEFRKVLKLNPMDDWAATSLSELQKQMAPKQEPTIPEAAASPQPEEPAADEELPETLSAHEEQGLWHFPPETKEETTEKQPDDLPLTERDLAITEAITHIEEGEELEEATLAEISGDDETADFQTIREDISEGISEGTEEGEVPELSAEEEEEEIDLWTEPAGGAEELLEEETPPESPMSREDLELWKSVKEAEDADKEPVFEAEEADEEALSFDDILQETEPSVGVTESIVTQHKETPEKAGPMLIEADRSIGEGNYAEAMGIYRKVLSSDPGNRQVLQRAEELKALLKLLGKDKEELIVRLDNLLQGIKKRRDEFFGTS
jgi:tetratricopeptide (TPR) repeat protein